MRAVTLGLALTLAAGLGAFARQEVRILAAPFGEVVRSEIPYVGIYHSGDRLSSHTRPLSAISAQTAARRPCDEVFLMALHDLASQARRLGGNGVIDVRSPGAPTSGAPRYACGASGQGNEVRLTGHAVRLTGSDEARLPRARTEFGTAFYGSSVETRLLPLPAWLASRPEIGVYAPPDPTARPRLLIGPARGATVSAVGRSILSCDQAFRNAAESLLDLARNAGGRGVEALRSREGSPSQWDLNYHCRHNPTQGYAVWLQAQIDRTAAAP